MSVDLDISQTANDCSKVMLHGFVQSLFRRYIYFSCNEFKKKAKKVLSLFYFTYHMNPSKTYLREYANSESSDQPLQSQV